MDCPVCLEVFKAPLLLPGCGHSICSGCAELMVSPENFLRCPECRLVYQLKKGLASLPRNIALERTIAEQKRRGSSEDVLGECDVHAGVIVSLYCRTCEKSICLKCYFPTEGASDHSDHQVDTSQDVISNEKKRLEEHLNKCLEQSVLETKRVADLDTRLQELQKILEEKLSEIEKNKSELISTTKKTASKLKFTVKGTIAKEQERLQVCLEAARERSTRMDGLISQSVQLKDSDEQGEQIDIKLLKELCTKLEALPSPADTEKDHQSAMNAASTLELFDTDLKACIADPKRALSYRHELPRAPVIDLEECVISSNSVHLCIKYNETVRTKGLNVSYKEALYKGYSEQDWIQRTVHDFNRGRAGVDIFELGAGKAYRCYVTAFNEVGTGPASVELRFKTYKHEPELHFV